MMDNRNGHTVNEAQRKLVRAFIAKEKLIQRDDNVCNMGKAFVVNSVLGWFLTRRAEKKISLTDMRDYVTLLQEYIDGKIDLSWNEHVLEILVKD